MAEEAVWRIGVEITGMEGLKGLTRASESRSWERNYG